MKKTEGRKSRDTVPLKMKSMQEIVSLLAYVDIEHFNVYRNRSVPNCSTFKNQDAAIIIRPNHFVFVGFIGKL
jgi:hypothetical protein